MKLTLIFLFFCSTLYSQYNSSFVGAYQYDAIENGILKSKTIVQPLIHDKHQPGVEIAPTIYPLSPQSNSNIRWTFFDTYAIASYGQEAGSGLYSTVGWYLNAPERVSLYNNASNTPVWEFNTFASSNYNNFVAISDTAGVIAAGSYHNLYMFDRSSSTPFFSFDLGSDTAGPIAVTSNGRFMIGSYSKQTDTSAIFGFSRDSAQYVWKYKIPPSTGGLLYGVKISRNDSVVIVNNYGMFYVFRTYTGQLLYSGPTGSTQGTQGISGNGNYIATINYSGFLKIYQWNGSTYNMLWQHQEPPGTYYNWMNAVDISNDGSMVACGTWNFPTANSYDGKVKLFRIANGSTPIWTYTGAGGPITAVSFSKNGNVLSASTWADVSNTLPDLLVFKVSTGTPAPIFTISTPGSLFWCSTSNDGSSVMTGGKLVHAITFGYGGEAYNIFIDTTDSPLGIHGNNSIPSAFSLKQNYPNPFNPTTQIDYSVGKEGMVNITVFDVLGREVAKLVNQSEKAGNYSVTFDAANLNSGVYFYTIKSAEYTETKKMVLIK